MSSPRRRGGRLQPGGPGQEGEQAPPTRGGGGGGSRPASPTYRVVYSSDDSVSDGELHVERRAGSLSAWYQRGTGAGRDSDTDGSGNASRPRSVTVVLHDGRGEDAEEEEGGEQEEEEEAEQQGVSWESNTLYDYVRGLAGRGRGGGQEGEPAGGELDSEEWAQRSAALRALLRERDGEVAALQALLEQRQAQLEGRGAEVAAAQQRCAALEERIAQLLRELQAAQAAPRGSPDKGFIAAAGVAPQQRLMAYAASASASPSPPALGPLGLKRPLAPLASATYQPAPDSTFVQLPAQSYAEHHGCGFWQGLAEGVRRHPRRCAAAAAALAALLLIVLCATLVPAAQRRRALPRFQAEPAVAAAGASWVDLTVQLDRPGLVSWMAFRQADLNRRVPGRGATLLELLQAEAVRGNEVHAASAPGASLDPAGGDAVVAGLQAMAVACGWAPVLLGDTPSTVSVLSAAGGAAGACSAAGAGAPARCARCPKLSDGTAYTLLLAAASTGGRVRRGVQVVNAATGDASVNVNSLEPPYADNVTAAGFDLHFKLNAPGTLHYAVVLDTLYAPYGPWQLAFAAPPPTASAVLAASPAAFQGGLVANGSVEVAAAGRWVSARVEPPCAGALCEQSLRGLRGGTAYRAYLLAVDAQGVADPAPAVVPVTTAPATEPPALLPATAPANITDSGFGMTVSMDAAGGVYWLLATAGGAVAAGAEPAVAPGSWRRLDALPTAAAGSRRRLAAAPTAGRSTAPRRGLLAASSSAAAVSPGTLVAPTCYPSNQTCSLAPDAAFAGAVGLDAGYTVVASGCTPVPAAGRPLALPPFTGLQNNTLHYLLLGGEDRGVPSPLRAAQPAVFAVRTVDLSAPRLACGFPLATNISSAGFALSAMLTKPGASVAYVVLPAAAAAAAQPTAAEVLAGRGAGGAAPAAAGTLGRQGWLPWEAQPANGAAGDERKMWAPVAGLQGGANYSAFFALSLDGSLPVPGGGVVELSGIQTPSLAPPSFTRLRGLNASVDEGAGTFSVQLSADLDRPGQVFYALYRNYSCITGDPSSADVAAGAALPPSVCKCEDRSYCALVTAGSFAVPAQALGAVHGVGGDVSPLPFQSLRNATADQLKCFQGGLGQATDTYNVYLVAGNALPSFTGLAPQCSGFAAAAAAAAGNAPDDACPAARQVACAQAQLRPDSQTLQSGGFVRWGVNDSAGAGGAGAPVVWQAPGGGAALGRPARVQLSLEGGTPPAFAYGPAFPQDMRTPSSFGLRFALDKPALLIYAVFRVMPIDAGGNSPPPVLIATGRVPVFDAAANATSGAITACPWAPGGGMKAGDQHLVTYVARDKYGRMDGLCPGQAPGSAPRVCTALVGDGGA